VLEYLDSVDSDSDFILESDTDGTREEEEDAALTTAHPVSDSEEDGMDEEDYREVLLPEQPLPLPFEFQELSGHKHMPPCDSSPIACFHLFLTDLILTLMVTESNRYAQQVISSKVGNVPILLKTGPELPCTRFLVCSLNMGIIKKPTIASFWSTLCS
jgi:hypothetical protein